MASAQPVAGPGLVEAAEGLERDAEIDVARAHAVAPTAAPGRSGPPPPRDCPLLGEQAQEMQRVRVPGIGGKDLPVEPFGFR